MYCGWLTNKVWVLTNGGMIMTGRKLDYSRENPRSNILSAKNPIWISLW